MNAGQAAFWPPQKPELGDDLREFVESLNSRGVDYTIVGAFAVAYHGYPGYTGDLVLEPKVMLTLGEIPNRIDVLTHIGGGQYGRRLGHPHREQA